ncbi:hypothetical protein RZ532_19255 [Nitratireductor aquimarinus]|uniref:hypothetical protein n=1 Tax=Nitratireductor aquimarinus TaxID=889300 RepID=UPI002935FC0C|nr:hypothetical protein [Nitratireductor aquimarinus]MDV2968137.1 hypothetical protein [Nitratireductor aquimarinus]
METITINNRDDFAEWAIQRANSILTDQGSTLATAARTGDENLITQAANALGQVIVDALLDSFDGLIDDASD